MVEVHSVSPSNRVCRSKLDALANPVTAPSGIGTALLPVGSCVGIPEINCEGDGKPGEEEGIMLVLKCGGVTAIGDRAGEEESTTVAVAIVAERTERSNSSRVSVA